MTAKFGSDDQSTTYDGADGRTGSNSPFNGPQPNAQLTAEIGRCLQAQYAVPSEEALPEKLADLVRRLQEQDSASQPDQTQPDIT
ncbi:NepR family anti-sigma factor [Microvirga yunnanensis]|uniref:NepR family anti-sigma factor n=1 Tax=Microvirga yunnanensis TaxID=2953740 RepID=UPI0021C6F3CC|nr:NepR family anti-sigma factor [Microvirga sp. HBU65207]